MINIIINEHVLTGQDQGGNGYHGYCKYCNAPLVTDLGYCSWEGIKCIDRQPQGLYEFPKEIISYVNFKSFNFNKDKKIFSRAYDNNEYTIEQICNIVEELQNN